MKQDMAWKNFLADNARFADVINGIGCGGEQVVRPEDLSEADTASGIGSRDTIRKVAFGVNFAIIGEEEQGKVNYSEALTVMGYDFRNYEKQAKAIRAANKEEAKRLKEERESGKAEATTITASTSAEGEKADADEDGEFMYHFKKSDRLHPAITFVLYAGEREWDAATSLHGLLDFTDIPEPIRRLTQDYRINVVEIGKLENLDVFKTDVRQVFEFLQCLQDKPRMEKLLGSDYYRHVDEDAYKVMAAHGGNATMKIIKTEDEEKKEEHDMRTVFDEVYDDGRNDGIAVGEERGMERGMEQANRSTAIALHERDVPDDEIASIVHTDILTVKGWLY